MLDKVLGIHHITAIASDPQKTYDFYTKTLGLRLAKKSVNQDDVSTYHLFFGDKTGEPGMDLTFFTFKPVWQGKQGLGQVTMISLAVPEESLDFWVNRFKVLGVKNDGVSERFGVKRLVFYDFDQQRFELVGVAAEEIEQGSREVWETGEITQENAIRYFYSARLEVLSIDQLDPIVKSVFGYERAEKEGDVYLYHLPSQVRASKLEIKAVPLHTVGQQGAGTVHHIAFEVPDEEAQLLVRDKLAAIGLYPTQVIERYYFKSVYFQTPAGILFELATSGPGFTVDEKEAELGEKLALPPFLEAQRKEIEKGLTPIEL